MNTIGMIVFALLLLACLTLCTFWVFVLYLELTDNLDMLDTDCF